MKYGCRTCRKEVKPVNGRLQCCGFDEPVPSVRAGCRECGGAPHGDAVAEFLGRDICYCDEVAREYDRDEEEFA